MLFNVVTDLMRPVQSFLVVILCFGILPIVNASLNTNQTNADEYEPDNDFSQATQIAIGNSQNHSIHEFEDFDFFIFTQTTSEFISIHANESTIRLRLEFYDNGYNYIDSQYSNDIRFQKKLDVGTYYFVITSADYNRLTEHYKITIEIPQFLDQEPNDLMETAQSFPINATQMFLLEWEDNQHEVDWIVINFTNAQIIEMELIFYTWTSIQFEVYDSIARLIAISRQVYNEEKGRDVHRTLLEVLPDLYYIKILTDCDSYYYGCEQGELSYTFQDHQTFLEDSEPNNDFNSAEMLEFQQSKSMMLEFNDIRNEYEEDYFQFSFSNSKVIQIQLRYAIYQGLNFELFDENFQSMGYSYDKYTATGQRTSVLTTQVMIGTFYLRVYAYNWGYESSLTYSVIISEPQLDALEPNDDSGTARDFGELNYIYFDNGFHNSTDEDWIKFSSWDDRHLWINSNSRSLQLDISFTLYDDNVNQLKWALEYAEWTILPGTYFIRISSSSGKVGDYNFWLDPYPYPDERENTNDDVEGAYRLPLNNYLGGNIHSSLDQDWWSFVLLRPAEVVIDTNGWSNDPELVLYNADLEELETAYRDDGNPNDPFPRIEMALESGTYYVLMQARYENYIDWYDITLVVDPILSNENSQSTTSSKLIIGDPTLLLKVSFAVLVLTYFKPKSRIFLYKI